MEMKMIRTGVFNSQNPITTNTTSLGNNPTQEEKLQQANEIRQTVEQQDLSRSSAQPQIASANVSYAIVNGQVVTIKKDAQSSNSENNNSSESENEDNSSSQTTGVDTKRTNPTYYAGYSLMANNSLSKNGLTIASSSVNKGIPAENVNLKNNADQITSLNETINDGTFQKEITREDSFWIAQSVGPRYQAIIGVNNQDNPILAQARGLSWSNASADYQQTGVDTADVVSEAGVN